MEQIIHRDYKPARYPITPEIHDAIVRVYQRDTGNGQVKALAQRLGYPRWRISRWAILWGLIAKQKKEPDWSENEINLLRKNARFHPEVIQRKLKNHGFFRSVTGIVLKRKRMRFPQNLDGMSATSLAQCLGVDGHFVTKAIHDGRLKTTMRETRRTAIQGGDSYFIKNREIRKYILTWLNEIDIRKVDKYWFVDLLTHKD
jgi:hypothetical protein